MPLTIAERKQRLRHGAQIEIAREVGVSRAVVSEVVSESYRPKTDQGRATERRIRVRIARKLGMRVDDVFPPQFPPNAPAGAAAPLAEEAVA